MLKVTLNVWVQGSWQIIFPSAWESHHRTLPTADVGMQPKLPFGRLRRQGLRVPATIGIKCCQNPLKNTHRCRKGKETVFLPAEVHHCSGGSEARGWVSSALLRISPQSMWCPNVRLQHQEGMRAGKMIFTAGICSSSNGIRIFCALVLMCFTYHRLKSKQRKSWLWWSSKQKLPLPSALQKAKEVIYYLIQAKA